MDPETLRAWQRIFRDFVIVLVGAFILVYETVAAASPNPYLIGAGLTALGVPPLLRLNVAKEKQREED